MAFLGKTAVCSHPACRFSGPTRVFDFSRAGGLAEDSPEPISKPLIAVFLLLVHRHPLLHTVLRLLLAQGHQVAVSARDGLRLLAPRLLSARHEGDRMGTGG